MTPDLHEQILLLKQRIEALEKRRFFVVVKQGNEWRTVEAFGWDGEEDPPFEDLAD